MKRILPYLFFLYFNISSAQDIGEPEKQQFRVMFYNVENLFDPFHDSLKNDYEFVGGGIKGWNWKKFERKLNNISKVIITAGGWRPPEIVAFSEVENRFVLIQLLKRTPLERFGYRIIHMESPDERGIDVGLIYMPDKFKEISHRSIPVISADTLLKSRDILYVKGILKGYNTKKGADTIHLFVNHWPSRSGGPAITAYRRKAAAISLKPVIDSIFQAVADARIILTGDFNDEPTDESIKTHLDVSTSLGFSSNKLYNLMTPYVGKNDTGTNKFRNQWGVIDQFIVSGILLDDNSPIQVNDNKAEILAFPFLLQEDEKWSGTVPFRTYNGMKYLGGFSDHLPVLLTLKIE